MTTNVYSSIPSIGRQSSTIRYEHFTSASRYRNNQSVISPSGTINKRKHKSKIIPKQNQLNPCNGSYIKTNGTTCGLKEIMIGRCNEYQYLKRGLYLTNTTEVKDCLKLYKLFESAARNKSYCNMNMSTYEDYFNYALEGECKSKTFIFVTRFGPVVRRLGNSYFAKYELLRYDG
ncbi:unnamed protein product [Rotaria sp. Silwood1]|nr:unnamed protein product [Rotaria sp. Silwood1]